MSAEQNHSRFDLKRAKIFLFIFTFGYGLIVLRGVWLQLLPSTTHRLSRLAKRQYEEKDSLTPYRGGIFDRKGFPLAVSVTAPSFAINPRVFPQKELATIAKILDLPTANLEKIAKKKNYFAWVKRKISAKEEEKIRALNLDGVFLVPEPSRYYPGGSKAASILGMVGLDGQGLLGIEQKLDHELKGSSIDVVSIRDGRGHQINALPMKTITSHSGNNILLTLDDPIQQIAEEALEKGFRNSEAKRAYAIVADPHTGRILALVNKPGFDPNKPQTVDMAATENSAINALFEPGSIVKPLVVAEALEQKITTPFEIHLCEKNGRLQIDQTRVIDDDHPKEFRTTTEILVHSSNIGVYKIAKRMGKKLLYDTFMQFGFNGGENFLELPGRQYGSLEAQEKWNAIRFANLAFGQGLLVTGLEMIAGYSVLANGGFYVKPYLVERIEGPDGELIASFGEQKNKQRVISAQTAHDVRLMLKQVVDEGTGTNARSEEYAFAGKTGTSQKVDPVLKKYGKDTRIASFAGFAPAEDPHLVILVVIDEPHKKPYYGGVWAAPVFKEIAENTLKYLNVMPVKKPQPAMEQVQSESKHTGARL